MVNLNRKTLFIFFFASIAVSYLIGLGALPFLGPDEPRYSQVAREMFERGDWVTPTLGGFHWFEKPALLYWLQIIGYKIFGVTEFAARAGSALFGLLTVLTIYLLCKFATNQTAQEENSAKNDFPLWALLISAASVGLVFFSHAATFDIILTFPFSAALACFFIGENSVKSGARRHLFFFGFYFFIGVALLAKGLIGAVLPFGIIFWYFVARRRFPDKTFILSLFWGALITIATAATWYLPMYWRHGWEFIDEFFVQHHFARYTSNKYFHPEPFWFFWLVLPGLTLPWLPFFLIKVWKIIFSKQNVWKSQETSSFQLFLLSWLLVPLVFFTFSGSKLPGYILPTLPPALILAAEEVCNFAGNKQKRIIALTVLAFAVFVFSAVAPFAFENYAERDSAKFITGATPSSNERVLSLHDISHSLEFYAAGRLVRTADGKHQKFPGAWEIHDYMQKNGEQTALVFVPLSRIHELFESPLLTAEKIDDNGEFALVRVRVR